MGQSREIRKKLLELLFFILLFFYCSSNFLLLILPVILPVKNPKKHLAWVDKSVK